MSKAIPPVQFTAPVGEIFNMEVQEVVATEGRPVVHRRPPRKPKHLNGWSDLAVGNIVKVQVPSPDAQGRGGESSFLFLLSDIRPTRTIKGEFAWLQGKKVNAAGRPVPQISHLHLPEGERQEFAPLKALTLVKE